MADKDLGQELENIEESIENLKNKEFRIAGIKVTPMTAMAAVTAIGAVIGSLYGGFLMYQKVEQAIEFVEQQEEYEAKIASYDERMQIMEVKLEEAVEYTRDIKSGLRDDILAIEKQADRVEDMVRESEERVRKQIEIAEGRFENKRDALQNDYDQAKDRLQIQTSQELKELEDRLNKKLQRALDNPLAN